MKRNRCFWSIPKSTRPAQSVKISVKTSALILLRTPVRSSYKNKINNPLIISRNMTSSKST